MDLLLVLGFIAVLVVVVFFFFPSSDIPLDDKNEVQAIVVRREKDSGETGVYRNVNAPKELLDNYEGKRTLTVSSFKELHGISILRHCHHQN